MFGQLGWGTWIVNARWLPTLAPASTAFLTRTRHWARLWAKLAVEVNWPTACSSKTVHRQPQMLLGLDDACEEWQKIDEMGDGVSYNKRHISSRGQSRNQELNACRETGFFFFFFGRGAHACLWALWSRSHRRWSRLLRFSGRCLPGSEGRAAYSGRVSRCWSLEGATGQVGPGPVLIPECPAPAVSRNFGRR